MDPEKKLGNVSTTSSNYNSVSEGAKNKHEASLKLNKRSSQSDDSDNEESSYIHAEKSTAKELNQNAGSASEKASEPSSVKLSLEPREDPSVKRELLKKLCKVCGVTFFANISTIEHDLVEYVKELLDNETNWSHDIKIRDDGVRAGEEITIYDSKSKTMYHTAFSRLTRKEIEGMLKLVSKFDKKSKYSSMRLLPLSITDIEKALERAKNGDLKTFSKSPATKMGESTQKSTESNDNTMTPYGKWIKDLEHGQKLNLSIKDKYFKRSDSEDERTRQLEREKELEIEREK